MRSYTAARESFCSEVAKALGFQAEQELLQAIDIARDQEAKLFELRAATSLAHLWTNQGRQADACELLTPIYGWFGKSVDMRDLREARKLLARFDNTSSR